VTLAFYSFKGTNVSIFGHKKGLIGNGNVRVVSTGLHTPVLRLRANFVLLTFSILLSGSSLLISLQILFFS